MWFRIKNLMRWHPFLSVMIITILLIGLIVGMVFGSIYITEFFWAYVLGTLWIVGISYVIYNFLIT